MIRLKGHGLALRWRGWRAARKTEREIRAEDRAARKAGADRRRADRKAKRATRQAARPAPGSLRIPRMVALVAIAVVVGASALTSFAESYRGLYDWATGHTLTGTWAAVWPLMVDSFIAVGELALFVGLADSWTTGQRAGAWTTTLVGLVVSVAGNIGHVHSHVLSDRATAAVPPLAAFAALWVGLGVLKRVVGQHHAKATTEASAKATAKARATRPGKAIAKTTGAGVDGATSTVLGAIAQGQPVPSARALARVHHIGRDKAGELRAAAIGRVIDGQQVT